MRTKWIMPAMVMAMPLMAANAYAISHSNSFSAPLTIPYPPCGAEDDSTSYCDDAGDLVVVSPWTFSQGTVQIDDTSVSLRLDDIELRTGLTCTGEFGNDDDCSCWNDTGSQADCDDSDDCGGDGCGPTSWSATDNNYFTLRIFVQDYAEHAFNIPTDRIRRASPCFEDLDFDVKNTSGNKNREVNDTISSGVLLDCGYFSEAHAFEIRHVDVVDKHGRVVAVVSH